MLSTKLEQDRSNVAEQIDAAQRDLVDALLPRLDAARLTALSIALGVGSLHPSTLHQRQQQRAPKRDATLARVRADPLYANRDGEIASIEIREAELRERLDHLGNTHASPRMRELLECGYGTDAYPKRWWQMQFYSDWRDGDALVAAAANPHITTFAQLRTWQLRVDEARATFESGLDQQNNKRKAILQLVSEHDGAVHIGQDDQASMYADARLQLIDRMRQFDVDQTARLLPKEEARMCGRLSSLMAQQRYLRDAETQLIAPAKIRVTETHRSLSRERDKLHRPKNFREWSDAQVHQRFGKDRLMHAQKARARVDEFRAAVVNRDFSDRYDPVADFVWWDVMTDGKLDGNFIDEVRTRPQQASFVYESDTRDSATYRDAS
jgi:hypothetical protein